MPVRHARRKKAPQPAQLLLAWYDVHRRQLPWRAAPGKRPDPYQVWLSEIMLQQTTVVAVGRYFRKFLKRWPTVEMLAAASLDEVLAAWSGLGYYARARNLHRAAQAVVSEHRGVFPTTAPELRCLPGIGAYTAGAIAAIAFDRQESAIDANAERVLARYFGIQEPLPSAKKEIRERGAALVPEGRPGDFAQALMDLGAVICSPRAPSCGLCPWHSTCVARRKGIAERLPAREAPRRKPLKRGAAFVARDPTGAVLLIKRPPNGLLGSMMQPPLGPWTERFPTLKEALAQAPFSASWKKRLGIVRHGFTHFDLEIETYVAKSRRLKAMGGVWIPRERFDEIALPTLMRKIISHALGEETTLPIRDLRANAA